MTGCAWRLRWLIGVAMSLVSPVVWADDGVLPTDRAGRALNLDFETGTLADWRAEGEAFAGQPVEGDVVAARRSDMKSGHQGRFWVGSFERDGDRPKGSLTSAAFVVTKPWASFLVAGGRHAETCVELARVDTGKAFFRTSGDETEELKRVAVDLKEHQGKEILIRLVDGRSDGWGHLNFDDFRLHDARPDVPQRATMPTPDVYAHAGLSPEAAAKAMTVPPGFRVTLFAGEPDVVQPIAMTIDERGRVWVAEAYSYPVRVPDDQAKDRILIFEDLDHDGTFDKRTVFTDKLNLVSGLEVGFGGVWVGAAPYLLFIPDKDKDDRPDGPPQVLLDGWAMEDTHETLNSFIWGPDGWLYGCHGVFTHSLVGKPGTPESARVPINAGIWRYHPTRHEFEVFAHGTSNPWGVDFDANGQCFIEACVIPHLYHIAQGGRYERQAGVHFNPYTYDDIKTIADHRHYVGANPHAGNNRSDSMGGGHAHAGLMIYDGTSWPAEYRGGLFMNNIHGARLNHDVVTPRGSGFVGSHRPDFLLANDAWSQIVSLREGPDGGVYLIDWYDKNQCHRNETEMHDRTNGRIFRVTFGDGMAPPDLAGADATTLLRMLAHGDGAQARLASRLILERGLSPGERDHVFEAIRGDQLAKAVRLRGLWVLHGTGGLEEEWIRVLLADEDAHLRAWTIQLACEGRRPTASTLERMAVMAKDDPSPVVRLYLASAVQRLPETYNDAKWRILEGLVHHAEDADDPNLPSMVWYAAEPLAGVDASRALALAAGSALPNLLSFMTRRVAAIGTPEAMELLVDRLGTDTDVARRRVMLKAMNEALQGRRQVEAPAGWASIGDALMADGDADARSQAIALGVTFGDARALDGVRAILTDAAAPADRRAGALAALLKARDPRLPAVLRELIREAGPLRQPALRGLAAFDDEETPRAVLAVYAELSPVEKRDALTTLAARPASARALLDAVGTKSVAASDLTADLIRNLRNLKDASIDARIAEVWGQARETPAEKARLIERYREVVHRGYSDAPDPMLGRAVWAKTCGQCHTLFGVGSNIGPDLTGSNRADLEYVLSNVVDPSALVGKDYQATVIATADGRTLTGIVRGEDDNAVTLVMQNETVVVPKAEIEERKLTEQSLMPEDQWANLSAHEVRSLVAYLASPNQVPLLATSENVASFFNGKDLSGWRGDDGLWSVEEGEIVGRSTGLDHNAFLVSEMAAGDFRLSLRVKLVGDEGNSGVQFRSASLPDGEMRGYQADIGPGWWGKLYEENGRALLWDKSGEEYVKRGDWNTYEIVARGSKITTRINGQTCVDLDDPAGMRRGVFGLQLHSGGPTEVRFREIRLEVIDASQPDQTAAR
jgi:putative membrane-bound dehydrogenase-like protein